MNANYDTGVMFPSDVHDWLMKHFHFGYSAHVAMAKTKMLEAFGRMGIPVSSELAHLYLNYGPGNVRGWYELNEIDVVEDDLEYVHDELGVPEQYIGLTGTEGDGITLYCRQTGSIYNVGFGQFEDLEEGRLEPVAATLVDFLRWCQSRDDVEFGMIEASTR